MPARFYLLAFASGILTGTAGWESARAWLVWRAQGRRVADALAPHTGAGLARTAASLTDGTRLLTVFAVALAVVLAAVVGVLAAAILTSDGRRRVQLARWVAAGLGVLIGGLGAFYARIVG